MHVIFITVINLSIRTSIFKVQFKRKVFPAELHIYQTQNAGGMKRIEAKQPDNQWYILWETNSVDRLQINKTLIFIAEFNVS